MNQAIIRMEHDTESLHLGGIIENDEWESHLLDVPEQFELAENKKLVEKIKLYKPNSLSELYELTRDREIIAHAMQLANDYVNQKIKNADENSYTRI